MRCPTDSREMIFQNFIINFDVYSRPENWNEDEPEMIPDPEAKVPEDWDIEMVRKILPFLSSIYHYFVFIITFRTENGKHL